MKYLLFGASAMAISMALSPVPPKYVVVTEEKLFEEAKAYCESTISAEMDAPYTLAMPKSPELNAEIYAAMKAVVDNRNAMWIGLTDSEHGSTDYVDEGIYRFADGSLLTDVAVNFPNGFPWGHSGNDDNKGNEDCVGIFTGSLDHKEPLQAWNDMVCPEHELPFICGPEVNGATYDKVYWSPDGDKLLWQEAAQKCIDDGGLLAMPKSKQESEAMMAHSVVGDKDAPFWIGLSDYTKEGEWRYVDGTALSQYTSDSWGRDQPDDNMNDYLEEHQKVGEDCAGIFTREGTTDKVWNDMPCLKHPRANKHYFICEGRNLPEYLTATSVSASTTLPYIAAVVSWLITVAVILRSYLKKAQKTTEYTPITQEYGAVSV